MTSNLPHKIFAGLSLLLLFGTPTLGSAKITRGPYLQSGTSTTQTIVWRTKEPSLPVLKYGHKPDAWIETIQGTKKATQHAITIKNLDPNTTYHYTVGKAGKRMWYEPGFYFRTAPKPGTRAPLRVWIVGDSGTGYRAQRNVRDAMTWYTKNNPPHLFLHMGDMAYNSGTDEEFQRNFFDVYRDVLTHTNCWPTLGNHEGLSSSSAGMKGPYYDAYVLPKGAEAGGLPSGTEAYYSFDYANVHFVVLDSHDSPRRPGGAMLEWLEHDLAATKQPWIVAYWHHPPYSKGSHDSDKDNRLRQMRENALPILEAGGVDLVLGGHSHIYERSHLIHGAYETPTSAQGHIMDAGDGSHLGDGPYIKKGRGARDGAVYVVAGHGGAHISKKGQHPVMRIVEGIHGSCILDVEGQRLRLRNLRADGTISDDMTILKEGGIVWLPPQDNRALIQEQLELRWASPGIQTPVSIRISHDEGKSWSALTSNLEGKSSYTWTAPDKPLSNIMFELTSGTLRDVMTLNVVDEIERDIIPYAGIWRYHDVMNAPPENWMKPDFDDSSWKTGQAPLGYGDGDETTRLLDADPNVPSVYFRKQIEIVGTPTRMTLRAVYDDAMAIWVNGTLIFEVNMEKGLQHKTWASRSSEDNAIFTKAWKKISSTPWKQGNNTIAVMVKQASASSSDVSFDLSLKLKEKFHGKIPSQAPPKQPAKPAITPKEKPTPPLPKRPTPPQTQSCKACTLSRPTKPAPLHHILLVALLIPLVRTKRTRHTPPRPPRLY